MPTKKTPGKRAARKERKPKPSVRTSGEIDRLPKPKKTFMCTDTGNAERLIYYHGKDLRYCFKRKEWLVWDGKAWTPDTSGEVERRAKHTVKQILREAYHAKSDDDQDRFDNWFSQSQNVQRIQAMIRLAQSEPGVSITELELDAHPDMINVQNGVLHLPSGKLHPHDRCYLMTKTAPVDYVPGARDAVVDRMLEHISKGDAEYGAFIRRAAGYSISGSNSEEVIFFLFGPESTGKTTLIEGIKSALGPYALTTDFETFIKRKTIGGPRDDLARLPGARFVSSVEVDQGKEIAEALIKTMSGGDTVSTRGMYGKQFDFLPMFNLWLAANHQPRLSAADGAIWRRIKQLPFDNQVTVKDRSVKKHIRESASARSAILAWMVAGYQDWRAQGLNEPQCVTDATAKYRESQDSFALWFKETCVLEPTAWTSTKALRASYDEYFRECGEGAYISKREFTDALAALGLTREQDKTGDRDRGWRGVRLHGQVDFQVDLDDDLDDFVKNQASVCGTDGTDGTALS